MNKSNFLVSISLTLFSLSSFGQIEVPSENEETEIKEIINVGEPEVLKTEAIGYAGWFSTNRELLVNEGLFADTLGARADEISLPVWSFGLGIRSQINSVFWWQGGVSMIRNGEAHSYTENDTTYSYQTKYAYLGMPLKFLYSYGDKIRLYGGIGIIPQIFMGYRQDSQWESTSGASGDDTFKTKSGYNMFVMSAVGNVGVHFSSKTRTSFFIEGVYRYQFTNSYVKTEGLRHFGRALGFNVGLAYTL